MEDMDCNGRDRYGKFAKNHNGFKRAGLPEMQRQTREKLWAFFSENLEKLPAIFQKLNEREQARVLLSLAEFFHPKQRELFIDANVEAHGARIDYTKLSETTLREILAATTLHENGNI